LSLARQFGVALFMPRDERTNLQKGCIPTAMAGEQSRADARES